MNDNIVFPFKKNRYVNGMMLTAENFITEQNYLNNKRRLLNILNMGSGVLYGLNVERINEDYISVSAGVAIDASGREIILSESDNFIISNLIKSLPETKEKDDVRYLCIEYAEKGVREEEQSSTENNDFIQEKYKFVLYESDEMEQNDVLTTIYSYEKLYEEPELVSIWHKAPKNMNAGMPFECSFIINRLKKDIRIKMDYTIKTDGIKLISEKVYFEDTDKDEKSEIEYTYVLEGASSDGKIYFKDLKLEVGSNLISPEKYLVNSANIQNEKMPLSQRWSQVYFDKNETNEIFNKARNEKICLAKLFIRTVKWNSFNKCIVIHAEKSIYTRYLTPRFLQDPLLGTCINVKEEKKQDLAEKNGTKISQEVSSTTGIVKIYKEEFYKKKNITKEIHHHLGVGPVMITTGFEEHEETTVQKVSMMDGSIYSGNADIFDDEFASSFKGVSIGVLQYPQKGTFRLGVRIQGDMTNAYIEIRWWAKRCEQIDVRRYD